MSRIGKKSGIKKHICDVWEHSRTPDMLKGTEDTTNWLDEIPFIARYVRINPQHWVNDLCLRVEFYGCHAECTSPLGMEYGMIWNYQITSSSETTANKKEWGRLNSIGWCADVISSVAPGKELYHYIQIDLLETYLVRGVATQGKQTDNPEMQAEGVTSFFFKYSLKGEVWSRYHTLLVGEYRGNSVMRYWLEPPLVARFIQFNPQSSLSPMYICMRVEVYGCVADKRLRNYLPLGMECFSISDLQLSASSQADASHSAVYSRLNHHIGGGAWMPATSNRSEYLQIDLGWIMILTGIATQGHPERSYRTMAFTIKHGISLDEAFKNYPKEFNGNIQEGFTAFDSLNSTACRYLRICPLSWSEKVALRVELYGYEEESACYNRLGVSSSFGRTLFSASSSAMLSLPEYGYLHSGLGTGAWCAETQDTNQYLQVDLMGEVIVTGVATQGQKYFDNWVSFFTLAYSHDGNAWHDYFGVNASRQVFTGNEDRDTAVLHFFTALPLRYLRFLPQSWKNKICMRVEIYGCDLKFSVCASCSSNASCIRVNNDEICVCNYEYIGDGQTCQDRDECSSSINPCPENTDCFNTVGSYYCKCKRGFANKSPNCTDIDECTDPNRCPNFTKCVNTPGSFICDCGVGMHYDPNNQTCKDVDECSTGSFICHSLANCVNNHGSYTCLCRKGYTGHASVFCVDINECNDDPKPCANDTVCENVPGSYRCNCHTGYGWKDNKCVDIDECVSESSPCPLYKDCVNTVGSYMCNCESGFISSGPYCIDLNECLSNRHNCDVNAWCTNTAGSYNCFCKEGYHGNGFVCEKGA